MGPPSRRTRLERVPSTNLFHGLPWRSPRLPRIKTLHADPAWAIVQLVESSLGGMSRSDRLRHAHAVMPAAELAHLPGGRALIVVQPRVFARLRGVSTIPLSDGRAFLAFDGAGGIADLEVAILDRLEEAPAKSPERAALEQARATVRAWRQAPRLTFRSKSIIVVEGANADARRPLARLGAPAQPNGKSRRVRRRP